MTTKYYPVIKNGPIVQIEFPFWTMISSEWGPIYSQWISPGKKIDYIEINGRKFCSPQIIEAGHDFANEESNIVKQEDYDEFMIARMQSWIQHSTIL